ncbi:MAG: FlgO family outer membrane protein, partial [Bacteroidales bacterium]|nr:FlgO family outer membrane protein [Bacteroidales bacterium]
APLNENVKPETVTKPNRKILTANNFVIAILLALVGVLAYPKVFNTNKSHFDEVLDKKKTIAVLPFMNNTGNDSNDHWEYGISELLISSLSTSNELTVIDNQTITDVIQNIENVQTASIGPNIAKEVASKIQVKSYIYGNYLQAGSTFRINLKLIETKSNNVLKTEYVEGEIDSIFSMVGSLANAMKSYLEIALIGEGTQIETADFITTDSPEAYKYFIQGMEDFWAGIGPVDDFSRAIEIDSTFTSAYFFVSIYLSSIESYIWAKWAMQKADEGKQSLSPKMQLWLEAFMSQYINKNPYRSISYFKQVTEIDPFSRLNWFWLGMSYWLIEEYDEALLTFEHIEELDNQLGPWNYQNYYTGLGNTYRKLGKYKKAQKIYKKGSLLLSESHLIPQNQAICALLQKDTSSANHYISQLRSAQMADNFPESLIRAQVGRVYERAMQFERAEEIWNLAFEMRLNQDPEKDNGFPGNELFWYYEVLGNLYIDNNMDIEQGIEYLQKALLMAKESERSSDHPKMLSGLGSGYYKQGKYVEALQALKQAEDNLSMYDHSLHQLIQEVEQALADQNN